MKQNNSYNPSVSVLITSFNAGKHIHEALESITSQTYKNLEIIIVDDCSTDNTWKILKDYQEIDKRIRVFRTNRHSGPSIASNLGLKKAKGDLIARMDADDIAYPDRIAKQVRFIGENPRVILVGGQCSLIDGEGKIIGSKQYPLTHLEICRSLFSINPIQHPSCMINKNLIPKGELYYVNHSFLAHDLELVYKLAQYGELANLPDKILYYRQHKDSLSMKNPKKTFQATFSVRIKAVFEYGYRPTFRGWINHFLQAVVITVLPKRYIYPLFQIWRYKRTSELILFFKRKILSTLKICLDQLAYRWQSYFW